MDSASIFDLSPSEKLQLVEDLWDDLAAAPEAVPVHDWQRQELARRKANLLRDPASGMAWERRSAEYVRAMPVELVIAPEAELDIAEAYEWYEGRRVGLGEEFLSSIDACLESTRRRPEMYPVVDEGYRRSLIRRFPYAVFTRGRRRQLQSMRCFIPLATRTNGASAVPDGLR